MTFFKKKRFDGLFDRGESFLVENIQLEECDFSNCGISLTKEINRRAVVKNLQAKDCSVNWCSIGPAIFEDVSIEGLSTGDLLIFWGALFRRVVFSGEMGKLKLNHHAHFVDRAIEFQRPFDEFRSEFYSATDWALDISRAKFKEFDVRGIPARLFRRDPESQVIVTRERALNEEWRKRLEPSNNLWLFMIDLFLSDGDADMVLVAPLGAPKKKRDTLLQGLHELRKLGVAEPD